MSTRVESLDQLRITYDAQLDKDAPASAGKIARALADAKYQGASDRECMDAIRSRDWARYKRYKDRARQEEWLA